MMRQFLVLVKKDLLLETRTRDGLVLLFGLAILLALVAAFGISSAFLNPTATQRVFPALLWMVFLFSSTVCLGRTLDKDMSSDVVVGIQLAGVSLSVMYVAKTVVNFMLVGASQILVIAAMAVLLNVDVWPHLGSLILLSLGVAFGYTALATLLAGIAVTSKLRGMLLPLILFPLLFPLLFAAVEVTLGILEGSGLQRSETWVSLVLVLDVLYLLAGINLFPVVIRE